MLKIRKLPADLVYRAHLDLNRVKGAKFSLPEAANLLLKYDIKLV